MAETREVRVPDIGDFDEVDVIEVLVGSGDQVAEEDSLITLESDKATMDVPAPFGGKVREVEVKAGDKVGEGDLILVLETEEAAEEEEPSEDEEKEKEEEKAAEKKAEKKEKAKEKEAKRAEEEREEEAEPGEEEDRAPSRPAPGPAAEETDTDHAAFTKAYASPAVRRFARQLGVDLSRVKGTGRKSRILEEDVQKWVKKTLTERREAGGAALPEVPVVDFSQFGEVEQVPLSRIQRISGPRLQASWLNLPHVTQNDEADITELEELRNRHKARAQEEGFNLTPLAFVMKAAVLTLKEFPGVNASLDPDGEHLVLKKYYHLGFAVDTDGGLVVPVLRDVDRKSVFEIARELAEISQVARDGKLKPEQIRGASFTISSLGSIGGTFFSPIVNAPEVALLGVARARTMPVWRDGEFVPRLILPLSLSYDHRVVDGAQAVRFTTRLCELLSDVGQWVL